MPQPLLDGAVTHAPIIDDDPVIDPFAERVSELESRVAALESSLTLVKRDAVIALLQLLGDSLRHVASGKMDIPNVTAASSSVGAGAGKWEALKQKYAGTHISGAIEALQIHGRLSTTQLAANLKTSKANAYNNIVPKLIRLGIVTRQGSDLVLRES